MSGVSHPRAANMDSQSLSLWKGNGMNEDLQIPLRSNGSAINLMLEVAVRFVPRTQFIEPAMDSIRVTAA
ncbi:hypothetical protein TNCT_432101 [Trichonephila clavata]|uniref:Uncharacterized protein n=1 Tax=Trichonephila clavata TaxID=2740835 RepID=A0A8X6LMK9_TRICU|nr:hypothetical protein TNCT_432101 [Trichonephila clavata]